MLANWIGRSASAVLVAVGLLWAGHADAGSREEILSACQEAMKREFGKAEFEFSGIRRNENRNFAFGEMTLEDGSKQRVRCRFQRGKVRDVRFRSDKQRLGDRWTNERPAGAVYVPLDDEAEDPASIEAGTTVPEGEADEAEVTAPQEDEVPSDAAADDTAEGEQTAENAETVEAQDAAADEEPELVRPKFLKAPTN